MRKVIAFIFCLIFILSGCNSGTKIKNSSVGSSSSIESSSIESSTISTASTFKNDVMKNVNPLDLIGMTYGEITDKFGKNHSELKSFEGSIYFS